MRSLRNRLLAGVAGGTAIVLLGAAVALYLLMRGSLNAEFDRHLQQKSRTLAALVEQEGGRVELDFAEADLAEFTRADRPEYFQVWNADGAVVERSPSLRGGDLLPAARVTGQDKIRSIVLPDGRPGKIAMLECSARREHHDRSTSADARIILALARDDLEVRSTLTRLGGALVLIGVLAILTSVSILAWLVRTGLRPVDRLATDIAAIDVHHLSARLDTDAAPIEFFPIIDRLNGLLTHLEAAFAREKTMTANVAHELRTPLAGLRAQLEVALARVREPAAYQAALKTCLAISVQTQTLVDDLLALARLDADHEPTRRQPVDLHQLLTDAWTPFASLADRRKLTVRWAVTPGLHARTDPAKLRVVFMNLLANAAEYTRHAGEISIHAATASGRAVIEVTNTGAMLAPEQAVRVFDRFWRGDHARNPQSGHSGLGLAIARMIVERLGGQIAAEATGDGVFRIRVLLPTT